MLIKYVEDKFLPSKGRRKVNSQTRIYNDILNAFEGGPTYLSSAIFYYNNGVVCRAWCVSLAPFFKGNRKEVRRVPWSHPQKINSVSVFFFTKLCVCAWKVRGEWGKSVGALRECESLSWVGDKLAPKKYTMRRGNGERIGAVYASQQSAGTWWSVKSLT